MYLGSAKTLAAAALLLAKVPPCQDGQIIGETKKYKAFLLYLCFEVKTIGTNEANVNRRLLGVTRKSVITAILTYIPSEQM